MTASLFTEDYRSTPYWWDTTPRPEPRQIDCPAKADVVVIGAGYTGLSAALQTARAGRHTLVLDAEAAGWGCSSRNGGQISTSIKPSFAGLSSRYGKQQAFEILKEGHNALAWIEDFVGREKIDCNFDVCGKFSGALSPSQYEKLGRKIENEPAGLETGAYLVPRNEQHSELDTDLYHGGIVYPRFASVDPARFHQGMLNRVVEAGADLICHCPATAIEKDSAGFRVCTPKGVISTRDVIVASNGYTGTPTPWLRKRIIPIGSYIIATEPLAPGQMDRLIPGNRMIGDSRRVVFYYRSSPDRQRILFGGRVSFNETDPLVSGPKLHAGMVQIFPELVDTRISHSWAGFVGYTFDTMAHLGKHDGIYYAMGYCGSGVSMAGYLGMRIAQQLLGLKQGGSGFDAIPFQTRPFYTGNPWFLSASVGYYRLLDRLGL